MSIEMRHTSHRLFKYTIVLLEIEIVQSIEYHQMFGSHQSRYPLSFDYGKEAG